MKYYTEGYTKSVFEENEKVFIEVDPIPPFSVKICGGQYVVFCGCENPSEVQEISEPILLALSDSKILITKTQTSYFLTASISRIKMRLWFDAKPTANEKTKLSSWTTIS